MSSAMLILECRHKARIFSRNEEEHFMMLKYQLHKMAKQYLYFMYHNILLKDKSKTNRTTTKVDKWITIEEFSTIY
jgi:hypothetical protein